MKFKSDDLDNPLSRVPASVAGAQYEFTLVKETDIDVGPRHRKDYDEQKLLELAASIVKHGLLQPLVVKPLEGGRFLLSAGGRRLQAIRRVGRARGALGQFPPWPYIPCHMVDNVPEHVLQEIELEENIKREDLTWQEEALAFTQYYDLRREEDPEFTFEQLAAALGVARSASHRRVMVGRALRAEHKQVMASQGLTAAYNVLEREIQRAADEEVAAFSGEISDDLDISVEELDGLHLVGGPGEADASTSPSPILRAASADVLTTDFVEWARSYSGPKFNLCHVDFPYGVGHDSSDQGGSAKFRSYADSPEVFSRLLDVFLGEHERFLSESAHVLFWLSMDEYSGTVGAFKRAGFTVQPHPLIWHKSNQSGILPDPARGPRRVYETALLLSRGDRKVVRAVANCVDHPLDRRKAKHISEKPREVLEHFFTMLVDSSTRLLDPTCGCGNALVAAEQLGAAGVLGLDIDPEYTAVARSNLSLFRKGLKVATPRQHSTTGFDLDLEDLPEPTDEDLATMAEIEAELEVEWND